jgi:integrase/recombinase XerD
MVYAPDPSFQLPPLSTLPTISSTRQGSVTLAAVVPAVIEAAGERARQRFVEFFVASIRNPNTREAYFRAVRMFCHWCEDRRIALERIEPTIVAGYIEGLLRHYSMASVKQHLAAIRMLFDYLVTGGVVPFNPAAAVKGPRLVIVKGKTPVLSAEDCRSLLDAIDVTKIAGLRDRALIAVMVYSFSRIGATLGMDIEDVYLNGRRYWIRLHEKGGRYHEMPLHHKAEEYLLAYMDAANLHGQRGTPLFRTLDRHRNMTEMQLHRNEALRMIQRRARDAGIGSHICCHTFRATGLTEYMRNGGTLERARQMAAHASSKTTQMYIRTEDAVTLDEVERVCI